MIRFRKLLSSFLAQTHLLLSQRLHSWLLSTEPLNRSTQVPTSLHTVDVASGGQRRFNKFEKLRCHINLNGKGSSFLQTARNPKEVSVMLLQTNSFHQNKGKFTLSASGASSFNVKAMYRGHHFQHRVRHGGLTAEHFWASQSLKTLNFGEEFTSGQPIRNSALACGLLVMWLAVGVQNQHEGESGRSTPELCDLFSYMY